MYITTKTEAELLNGSQEEGVVCLWSDAGE